MTFGSSRPSNWQDLVFYGLAGVTLIVLLMAPLAALQPFDWGAWRLTSLSILMMYLGGALSAATLIHHILSTRTICSTADITIPVLATAGGGLLLAVGGIPGALVADFPWLAFVGTYQSGLGVLWFFYFSLSVLVFGILDRLTSWRRLLDFFLLTALSAIGVVRIVDIFVPEIVLLLPGGDSYAYLAAAGIAFSIAGSGPAGGVSWAILFVSVLLMVFSDNLAAIGSTIALGIGVVLLSLSSTLRKAMDNLRHPMPAAGLLLVTIVGPACLMYIAPFDLLPGSLQSRVLIHELSFAVLREANWVDWAVGRGWGHIQAAFYSNLLAADYPIYSDKWDFLWRDIFHSHNAAIEALLAGGVFGLVIHGTVFWLAIRQTARIGSAALWFLLLFYLLMAGLWFEYSFALPFLALAAVRCLSDETSEEKLAKLQFGFRWIPQTSLVLVGALFAVTFARMAVFEVAVAPHKFDTLVENPSQAVQLELFPEDPRGGRFAESILLRELWRKRDLLRQSRGWTDNSVLALALIDRAESAIPEMNASSMLLVGLSVFNDLAHQNAEDMNSIVIQRIDLWQRLVQAHWSLEPQRSDISVGLFEFLKHIGAFDRIRSITAARLLVTPQDPVAIFYAALVSLNEVPAHQNPAAMRSILRAINLGLSVIMPIDPQFEIELRNHYGDGAGVGMNSS